MNLELETILVEDRGNVLIATINRPKALNALNAMVLSDLESLVDAVAKQSELRVLILTGSGKSFVAGADIAAMAEMNPDEAKSFSELGHRVFSKLEKLDIPVVAAVNGFALGGGCELALSCDVVYASTKAKFGQPEVNLGLIPGFGGCVRLPRKVGVGAACEWIFSGEIYNAQKAQHIGLVQEIFEPDTLLEEVTKRALTMASRSPLAIRVAKQVIQEGLDLEHQGACTLEQSSFGTIFSSEDMREGTRAFLEKRSPEFKGS
jgi:enoyl-CoA hydratase